MPEGPSKKVITEYFSKKFGFSTLDELKTIVDGNIRNLDNPVIKENVEMAKRLVGEDDLYSISPHSRLEYVKRKLKGGKPSENLDPHAVAILMQEVCGVNAGADPENSFAYLYFLAKGAGVNKVDVQNIRLTKEQQRELEKVTREAEQKQDEYFERTTFATGLEADTPKPVQEFFDYMQSVYKGKFGEPERRGEYHCPIPQDRIDFCTKVVEDETGIKPPQIKVFIDLQRDTPQLIDSEHGGVSIPSVVIDKPIPTIESLLNEIPHLVTNYERMRENDFNKDRKLFFKKLARLEGIPEVIKERAFRRIIALQDPKNADDRARNLMANQYNNRAVMLHFVSDAFLNYTTIENTLGFATYYTMAYPTGWQFLRELDKPTFVSVVHDTESYQDPQLGWNKKITGDDRTFLNNVLIGTKNATKKKYRDRPDLVKIAEKQLDAWRNDFLT